MKKIKIAFAALGAVVGIGGAYAATHPGNDSKRVLTYNWHTLVNNTTVYIGQTVATVASKTGCTGQAATCLRGTAPGQLTVFVKRTK